MSCMHLPRSRYSDTGNRLPSLASPFTNMAYVSCMEMSFQVHKVMNNEMPVSDLRLVRELQQNNM